MRNWGKVDLMLFASHRTRPQVRAPAIMRPLLPVLQPGRSSQGAVTGNWSDIYGMAGMQEATATATAAPFR